MLISCLDSGLIDKKVARREIHERRVFANFNQEDIERIENEEGEGEVDMNDAIDASDTEDDVLDLLEDVEQMLQDNPPENIRLLLVVLRSKLREEGVDAAREYMEQTPQLKQYLES